MGITGSQRLRVLEICFCNDEHRLCPLIHRNGGQLVDDQRTGHRLHRAHHNEKLIYICHRGPDEHIFTRQDIRDDGRASVRFQTDDISRHRRDALFAEDSFRLAFHKRTARLHIIKPADALYDIVVKHPQHLAPLRQCPVGRYRRRR